MTHHAENYSHEFHFDPFLSLIELRITKTSIKLRPYFGKEIGMRAELSAEDKLGRGWNPGCNY